MSLQELSDKATPGPWEAVHADDGEFYDQPPTFDILSTDGGRSEAVASGGFVEDGGPSLGAVELPDALFIVALVNAFRSGRLVQRTPGDA